ncbi:hypothetical protein ZYGR_0AN00310 [Zygosaccharomyces rouxii]|uniref:Glycosyl transferase CAP10 domain-containing protein n=1 Tax=Zygosaccharomyces rouxii TaxID=4956 RepID=A0A1Q3AGF7_ZYGRO|nr:hypothetical protein ZYGR_0AN00310 [Zygosaccharomyces rouxii]
MLLTISLYFLAWLYLYQVSNAAPVENKIWKALETQDKICSMKYAENEGSYKRMFETLSGLTIPATLREYDKKPYTGFKVLRAYNIQLLNLGIKSTIDVVFCREGKIQWKIEQPLEDDIDWTKPLCVYTPNASADTNLASTKNKRTLKERALEDLNNLHCFKLARRKKYTNRKASLFFPKSWVGGMFYCDLDDELKRRALDNMEGNLQFRRNKGQDLCVRQNSIPLVPIQSDDYSKNWIEFSSIGASKFPTKAFKPQITKYVPYINTPNDAFSRLNFGNDGNISVASTIALNWGKPFREQALAIFRRNKMYTSGKDPWFSEIEVDEKYQISSEDISLWQTWTDHAVTKLSSLTNKPSKSFVSTTSIDTRNNNATGDRHLKDFFNKMLKKVESKIWNRLQLRDKIISTLGDDPQSLQYLQTEWKNLQMNCEKFDYSFK